MRHLVEHAEYDPYNDICEQIETDIQDLKIDDAIKKIESDDQIKLDWKDYTIPYNAFADYYEFTDNPLIKDEQTENSKKLCEVILKHPGFNRTGFIIYLYSIRKNSPEYNDGVINALMKLDPESTKIVKMHNKFDIL
jgi:hypothetical protein